MKMAMWVLVTLIVVLLLTIGGLAFLPMSRTAPQTILASDYTVPQGAGEYAMRAADCAGCHTAEGGQPFAGGRPIASPFGTIYSSNITPEPDFGIGDWSLDQFRAALYDGIGANGHNLYPAMPFTNYRTLSEEDIQALFAFFMEEIEPVAEAPPETRLAFPFNQRWGVRAWKWLALDPVGFDDRFDDPVLNRGAYLVEGPGHCGACHSPRSRLFIQEGYTSATKTFLSGGVLDGWSVPGLRSPDSAPQRWSNSDMVAFLRNGRNSRSAVVGEMHLVVADSLQYLTDDDLAAITAFLSHIGSSGPNPEIGDSQAGDETAKLLTSADPGLPLGARLYLDNCNACHFVTGKGAPEVFPELDGSSLVNAGLSKGLIEMILNGAGMPSTEQRPAPLHMPGFADRLSDQEVAELATFVRGAWSNQAGPVSAEDVAHIRSPHTSN